MSQTTAASMPPDRDLGAERAFAPLPVLFILGLTLWRIVLLGWNGTDLFVDEAQYWFWGRNLDFGYYSKPPMIGWLIRAVTELAGSSSPFWVRVPGPLLHMATALLLMKSADLLYGARVARWVGPAYVSLPVVAVGTFLFSTDTLMLPCLALALWMYLRCLRAPSLRDAAIAGLALGCGLLSKYAAVYFGIGVGLAALLQPRARLPLAHLGVLAGLAALVLAPNIWWNMTHDAVTVRHTVDNADWNGGGLHPDRAWEFFAAQFAVVGPVFFGALLWATLRAFAGRLRGPELTLLLFSMPIVALVVGQALMSRAYANWAVAAYVAGTILAVRMLIGRRWLLGLALALNTAICLIIPALLAVPERVALPGGKLLFGRYLGRAEASLWARDRAAEAGLDIIVSGHRDLLADLFYTLRDAPVTIYAQPPEAFPKSYYEKNFPVPAGGTGGALYLSLDRAPDCGGAELIAALPQESGAYAGQSLQAYRVDLSCFAPKEALR